MTGLQSAAFKRLVQETRSCHTCPRMEGRRRVLGPENGTPGARVLFVAEAPGRFGAERTGVPLSGDQSGRNFERLLEEAGLRRHEIFVTNAVLCNPRDAQGRNTTPSRAEVANCLGFLRETIDVVKPQLVVALGAIALHALDRIELHGLSLARDVGQMVNWSGRELIALYHPGPRAQIHRPLALQLADFRSLRETLDALCSTSSEGAEWH